MKDSKMHYLAREERLLELIEEAVFETDDDVVLGAVGARQSVADARRVLDAATRNTRHRIQPVQQVSRRRPSRRSDVRSRVAQRLILERLLVASTQARKIAGVSDIEPLTDAEIDELTQRLTEMGLLRPDDEAE